MEFEWDPRKASRNLRDHGVRFEDAIQVFFDPQRREDIDSREDYGEDRWITIGLVANAVLAVAYTIRDSGNLIRLISARKATKDEQAQYGEN